MESRTEDKKIIFFTTIIFYTCIISLLDLLSFGVGLMFFSKPILSFSHTIFSISLILAELRYGWMNTYIVRYLDEEPEDKKPELGFIYLIMGELLLILFLIFVGINVRSPNIYIILIASVCGSLLSLYILYIISCMIEKKKDFQRIKNDILANQSGMPANERLKILAEEYGFKVSDFLKVPLIRNLIQTQKQNTYR